MANSASSHTHRTEHPRWGVICMLLSIGFFSSNSLILKYLADEDISPWIALLFRAAVGLAFVRVVFRGGAQVDYWRAMTNRLLASRGILGVLGTIAYYFTVAELGPGKATLISNTYVVIAALMAVWFLREPFNRGKLAGNVFAFAGLTFLLANPVQLTVFGWYEALAVFGALVAAGTVIVIRQLTLTETTATIYTSQCVYVLAGSIPLAAWSLYQQPLTFSQGVILAIAGVSATVGQLAMTEGFRHLSVSVGGVFQICVPIVISIGGVLLFNEAFSYWQVLGAILILVGCYIVTAA